MTGLKSSFPEANIVELIALDKTLLEIFVDEGLSRFIVFGNAANNSRIALLAQHNDDNPGTIIIGKTRGSGNVILGTNDDVGQLDFAGNDGNGYYWDESVYQSDNTKGWVLDN